MLQRVFYVSAMGAKTTDTDIRAIVSASMVWNRRHDVTGLLIASQVNFSQVLEGRSEAIAAVMERIRRDDHHGAIELLRDERLPRRRFGRWFMAFVRRDDLSDDLRRLHATHDPALADSVLDVLVSAGQDMAIDL